MSELNARTLAIVALKGFVKGLAPIGLIVFVSFVIDDLLNAPSLVGLIALPFTIIGAWMCVFHGKLILQAIKTIKLF